MNGDLEQSTISTSLAEYRTVLLDVAEKHRYAAAPAITCLIVYCSTSNEEHSSQLSRLSDMHL